jgi:hypothetical protein
MKRVILCIIAACFVVAALATPPTDSYEHILRQLDGDIFLVDLRRMKCENGGEMDWFLQPLKFRKIGAIAMTQQFSQSTGIANEFDYLILYSQQHGCASADQREIKTV